MTITVSGVPPSLAAMYDPDRHLREQFPDWTFRYRRFRRRLRRGVTDFSTKTIWLDDRQKPYELRSTKAHEIVHVERGPAPEHLRDKEELICEDTGARRALPLIHLLDAVAWSRDVRELALVLEVDVPMMKQRLQHLDDWEARCLDENLRGRELTFPKE